jgi:hypothetical protein
VPEDNAAGANSGLGDRVSSIFCAVGFLRTFWPALWWAQAPPSGQHFSVGWRFLWPAHLPALGRDAFLVALGVDHA